MIVVPHTRFRPQRIPTHHPLGVIPAKAGIQGDCMSLALDPRFRGNDTEGKATMNHKRRAQSYFAASVMVFRLARPVSNSLPIMRSILQKRPITFDRTGLGPYMAHVTFVASALASSVNSAMLWPSNGLMKSSLSVTFDGGDVSVISMRPLPMFLLPSHSYTAPSPLAA